jgi:tRNA(Ile)-lysidine synthase
VGPDPAVAAVRLAVRGALSALDPGDLVLVACSGGADSLALAGALAFEAARSGHRAGGVSVDHGLQEGSAARAAEVVKVMAGLGLNPAEVVTVTVGSAGGPEAAARTARYAALDAAAVRRGAVAVMLGHTLDDQAETVLLGLARGSGARSLAGMSPVSGKYRRPLLDLDRTVVRRACLAMGLTPWDDPHNQDAAYARARVRSDVLPALEKGLGPRIAPALARTARMLREDADALDTWAEQIFVQATRATQASEVSGAGDAAGHVEPSRAGGAAGVGEADEAGGSAGLAGSHEGGGPIGVAGARDDGGALVVLDVGVLAEVPRAVRTRVLRRAAIAAGSPAGALGAVHVDAVDSLITAWRGQVRVDLPGRVRVRRRCERLLFGPSTSG